MTVQELAAKRSFFNVSAAKSRLRHGLMHYFLSLALIWLAIIFYRVNHYYKGFLFPETQKALLILALTYTIVGFFYYLLVPLERLPKSRGYVIANLIRKSSRDFLDYLKNFTQKPSYAMAKIDREEKTALLFVIVKIFFLPLMINFMLTNYRAMTTGLADIDSLGAVFTIEGFNNILFPLLFSTFIFVDTAFFTFGYLVESRWLGSKVRSVEPTVLGWAVALVCYPPFNGLMANYTSWYANDNVYVSTPDLTFVLRIIVLVLMFIYAFASVALGPKASNLTNRGTVSRWPYSMIRHPAYVAKNMAWWVTIIPVFSIAALGSMLVWSFIYFLRAITEERHLIRDPEYQAYCKKVRYRFIPKVV